MAAAMLRTFVGHVVLLCLLAVAAGQKDQTQEPDAKGAGVVEATCSRIEASCVFGEDKLFTRRVAYVESYDGADPKTFRDGYYGGIWQVDRSMFDKTQSSSTKTYLQPYFNDIKKAFGIDWAKLTWQDLTKPLHSALAARLYVEYESRNDKTGIPRSIDDQSKFWVKYYRTSGSAKDFVSSASRLEQGCKNGNGADIIFVLDGSGSIGTSNFEKIKNFVKDVVRAFDVGTGEKQSQIGVIKYSTMVKREFDLKTYNTGSKVISAVGSIKYEAGGTNTHLALDELVQRGFAAVNGARPRGNGHPRVGIVVTDGQSTVPSQTVLAATRAHDADITMIAVGIGSSINRKELQAIASDPVCLHLLLLAGFTEVDSLKSAITDKTCDAPIIIAPGQNSTTGGRLPPGDDQNCKIKVPAEGVTVEMEAFGGKASFYIARSTYPSSQYYEEMTDANGDSLGVIFIPKPDTLDAEGTMFCNIKGDNVTETNVTIGCRPGNQDKCKSKPCQNGGHCVNRPGSNYRCDCKPG